MPPHSAIAIIELQSLLKILGRFFVVMLEKLQRSQIGIRSIIWLHLDRRLVHVPRRRITILQIIDSAERGIGSRVIRSKLDLTLELARGAVQIPSAVEVHRQIVIPTPII